MVEYDDLYLVKNPFFLGTYEKAVKECENLVIDESDIPTLEKKTFYLVRSHLALTNWDKAEGVLAKHLIEVKYSEDEKEKFAAAVRNFIEFSKSGKYDEDFMHDEFEKLSQDPKYRTNPRNLPELTLITYILYSIKEFDCIIPLIFDIKDVDILGIKFLTYWQMKRYDYMPKCLEELKQFSGDSALTQLLLCFQMLATGKVKDLVGLLNEIMQKYDKSTKMYNFIGLALIAKGQVDKALKMYEKVEQELGLKDPEKCKRYIGNIDLIDMVANHLTALRSTQAEPPQIVALGKLHEQLGGIENSTDPEEFEEAFGEACRKVFS